MGDASLRSGGLFELERMVFFDWNEWSFSLEYASSIIFILISYYTIVNIANKSFYFFQSYWKNNIPLYYIHIFFQTINEEIVLGAMLLFPLCKKLSNLTVIIVVSAIFSLLHYVFYKWGPLYIENQNSLQLVTLISLFSIGIIRNSLIIIRKNIILAWSIHFAWNVTFFGGYFYDLQNNRIEEAILFNTVLGNSLVLITSSIIAFLLLGITWRKYSKKEKN